MIKVTTMPKETLIELLHFLAENEKFTSVENRLIGGVTLEEVRAVFRELARELTHEMCEDLNKDIAEVKSGRTLSRKTKEIISYLSPTEEKTLLRAFGFVER